jgi:excisionase family DNA binding protein
MNRLPALTDDFLREICAVPRNHIPAALGALAEADAHLRLRLVESRAETSAEADRLLTVADVAERLAVAEDYVYRHADGWPFTRRVGRLLRFSASGLAEWLAGSER